MTKKIRVDNYGVVTLTDKYYLSAGGEGEIYVNNGIAYKLYHTPKTKQLSDSKKKELSQIGNSQIVIPKNIIYDMSGNRIGYTTDFIKNVEPLLKFFTKTFKVDNHITPQMINELVKWMQLITMDVHKSNCLIVDYNELNVLVNTGQILTPYYIDTDGWVTPSSNKATAIMDSIRDRKYSTIDKNGTLCYNPTIESDWFSWAVLTFWAYSNIHPYRGNHPNYKPRDKQKQMDDNVSVFSKGIKLPPTVNDFKTHIPPRHLDYFIRVFRDGMRDIPPMPDGIAPSVVPTNIVMVKGTDNIEVTEVASFGEDVKSVYEFMGLDYVVTDKKIYCDNKEILHGLERYKKVYLFQATDGTVIAACFANGCVNFIEVVRQTSLGSLATPDIILRNGCVYAIANGKLIENSFTAMGNKLIHRTSEIENVSIYTTKVYEGCAIQNLLGKYFLVLPYAKGMSFSKYIPQLDGYRIVDCKAERNVVVVIAEKKGQYDRFVIVFTKKDFSEFNVRKMEDIAYDGINFTTMENGLTLLLSDVDELELFANNLNIQLIPNPPFDSTMKLFNNSNGIHFINGNSIHKIKRK